MLHAPDRFLIASTIAAICQARGETRRGLAMRNIVFDESLEERAGIENRKVLVSAGGKLARNEH